MERFVDLTIAQQQVQVAKNDILDLAHMFFFRGECLIGA